MKTTRLITTICWAVAALALTSIAIWFLTGPVFGFRASSGFFSFGIGGFELLSGPHDVLGTETTMPAEGVSSLSISWVSGDVSVEPYDGSDITFTEYAQRNLREGEHFSVKKSGGSVRVDFTKSNVFDRVPSKKLVVCVPRALCAEMDGFTGETVSGSFSVSDVSPGSLSVDSVSGRIELKNTKSLVLHAESTSGSIAVSLSESEEITLSSTSGDIDLLQSSAKSLRCGTTSGSQRISGSFDSVRLDSVSGTLTLDNSAAIADIITETTSGSQNLSGSFADADLRSISGKIKITSATVPESLTTDTTSGSVTVSIPDKSEISVSHSTTSGKFSSDIPVIMTNTTARFSFSSTSGSVMILSA